MGSPLLDRPTIPGAYLALLVELLDERGLDGVGVVEGLALGRAVLGDPSARISGREWGRAVLRALELIGSPALGYEYGWRMRPTVHGVLGFAAMTSATMRDSIAVSTRYFRARQANFDLSVEESDGTCRWILRERTPMPVPALRAFFVENLLIGMARGMAVNLGRELDELPGIRVWFDVPEPPHFASWRARMPFVEHDRPLNAVTFPVDYLALRPPLADPDASRQAIALCERELVLATRDDADLVSRVRALLVDDPIESQGFRSLDQVAGALAVSTRTLKRHLAREGTSFLVLLESARRDEAERRLRGSDAAVREIAAALGYENPANFSRAFHRWTGESPTAFRARVRR